MSPHHATFEPCEILPRYSHYFFIVQYIAQEIKYVYQFYVIILWYDYYDGMRDLR